MRAHLRLIAIVGVVLSTLTACGGTPTATLVASSRSIGPSDEVVVSGALSEKKVGLEVRLEQKSGKKYQTTDQSTTTDSAGAYKFTFQPSTPGTVTLRVKILDGDNQIASRTVTLKVLKATAVSARTRGSSEVGIGKALTVTGALKPTSTGRTVQLEKSDDGSTWSALDATAATDSDGRFSLKVPTDEEGSLKIRVTADATATEAAAASASISVFIADYKTAGKKYLSCVGPSNKRIDQLNSTVDKFNAGTASLGELKKAEKRLGIAAKAEITCIKGYGWPPSVAAVAKDFAKQDAVIYDFHVQASKAKTLADYNNVNTSGTFVKALDKISGDAAEMRRGLGLPGRS